jgi:hypothetical protein
MNREATGVAMLTILSVHHSSFITRHFLRSLDQRQPVQSGLTDSDTLVTSSALQPFPSDGPGDNACENDRRGRQCAMNAFGQFFGVQFAGRTLGPTFIADLH